MPTKFWKSLDALTDAATDRREWSILLGGQFESMVGLAPELPLPLLRSTGMMATSISCPSPGGEGCPRRIVRHQDGGIRAVCGDNPKACTDLDVAIDDIIIYGLDRIGLARRIAAALDLTQIPQKFERQAVFRIGSHEVAAGQGFPVFLTVPGPFPNEDMAQFDGLAGLAGPRLLLTPTSSSIPPHLATGLERNSVSRLALADLLDFDDRGSFKLCQPISVMFASLRRQVTRGTDSAALDLAWRLPTNAQWEEISIHFVADEVINVSFRGQTRRFEPDGLGLKNAKDGKPQAAWGFLKVLASQGGRLPIHAAKGADTAKYQKQKQALSKALREGFGISADPLPAIGADYIARFACNANGLQQGRQGQTQRKFVG